MGDCASHKVCDDTSVIQQLLELGGRDTVPLPIFYQDGEERGRCIAESSC
jgi:hypothetical protein